MGLFAGEFLCFSYNHICACMDPVRVCKLLLPGHAEAQAVMNDWNEAEQRIEKAHELFEQRRWNEALEELRAAISINPYNSSWFFNVGLTLDELHRFDEALSAYQEAVQIDPDDVQAMNHLGVDLCRVARF